MNPEEILGRSTEGLAVQGAHFGIVAMREGSESQQGPVGQATDPNGVCGGRRRITQEWTFEILVEPGIERMGNHSVIVQRFHRLANIKTRQEFIPSQHN